MAKITERTPGGKEVLASSEPLRPTSGTFKLGAADVPMALPPMLWRMRLLRVWAESPDNYDHAAVYAAAIGMCWGGPDGPPDSFAKMRRDVLTYGEAVYDWLTGPDVGIKLGDLVAAGVALLNTMGSTIPREAEVEAAAVPTEATTAPSTGSSSQSVSPGTATPEPPTA